MGGCGRENGVERMPSGMWAIVAACPQRVAGAAAADDNVRRRRKSGGRGEEDQRIALPTTARDQSPTEITNANSIAQMPLK